MSIPLPALSDVRSCCVAVWAALVELLVEDVVVIGTKTAGSRSG
jgi:hypothetical protein